MVLCCSLFATIVMSEQTFATGLPEDKSATEQKLGLPTGHNLKSTTANPIADISLSPPSRLLRKPVEQIPDFTATRNIKKKKNKFFSYLLPFIQAENERIANIRRRIQQAQTQKLMQESLCQDDREWLQTLAFRYKLSAKYTPDDNNFYPALLRLVDILPPSMVLAQGALESAWGQSRFARKGNNLFGEWCFGKGCGLVPLKRQSGMYHEVAKFKTVAGSVRGYFRNINTHPAYHKLRLLREKLHYQEFPVYGRDLTKTLTSYSQRGQSYVETIMAIINVNNLSRYDYQLPLAYDPANQWAEPIKELLLAER